MTHLAATTTCRSLWRFVVYWLWFIGLSFCFQVGVSTLVLPIPTGAFVAPLAIFSRQDLTMQVH